MAGKSNMIRTGFQKTNQAAEGKAEGEKGGKEINKLHKSLLHQQLKWGNHHGRRLT